MKKTIVNTYCDCCGNHLEKMIDKNGYELQSLCCELKVSASKDDDGGIIRYKAEDLCINCLEDFIDFFETKLTKL
jgi:hypothetical protein